MKQIKIEYLSDHPVLIETCASWAYSQWSCQSGGSHSVDRFSEILGKD